MIETRSIQLPPPRCYNSLTIALAADGSYFHGLVGTLSGILRRNRSDSLEVVILDCGISDQKWAIFSENFSELYPKLSIRRIKISPDQLAVFVPPGKKQRMCSSAFARLLLPELLPDRDRILYLDCDLYVDTDLSTLFCCPLEGKPVAAILDQGNATLKNQIINHEILGSDELNLPAFNSGVLLLDLKMIRRTQQFLQFIEKSKQVDSYFGDQGILNLVFRGKWKALPDQWNRQVHISDQFTTYRPYPDSIWHFVGERKPWHFDPKFSRGIVANFHRDLFHCQWPLTKSLNLKPSTPVWRDLIKKIGSDLLRCFRRFTA